MASGEEGGRWCGNAVYCTPLTNSGGYGGGGSCCYTVYTTSLSLFGFLPPTRIATVPSFIVRGV